MMKLKIFFKYVVLFIIGGIAYCGIEMLWRGYSHWTMFLLGGVCFIALGLINEILPWQMPLTAQMFIGCAIITALEFITGCIVNLWLGWDVWDYSELPCNLLGQISLKSSVGWYFLSAVGIVFDDWLRYIFFGEEKPNYTII